MPTNKLAKISRPPDSKPGRSTEQTVREWLVTFAELYRKNSAPYPLTPVMTALWINLLGDLNADVLDAACRKVATLGCRREFPTPADICQHIEHTEGNAVNLAAEKEWQRVLELRRLYWCPDMPGGFSRGMPKLSERVQQACRAAGVFRDYENADQLHIWAHKRFVESFIAWGELEQDQHLLPDGEVKNLLAQAAQAKALPAATGHDAGNARPTYLDEPVIPTSERWGPEEQAASLKLRKEVAKKFPVWVSKDQRRQIEAELAEYGNRVKAIAQEKGVTLP